MGDGKAGLEMLGDDVGFTLSDVTMKADMESVTMTAALDLTFLERTKHCTQYLLHVV
jgi:hypothetical protein